MARRGPFGAIRRPSNSGSGDKDGPQFFRCVDRQQPKIYEVWSFGEDGVTHKVHLITRVDIGAFVVE